MWLWLNSAARMTYGTMADLEAEGLEVKYSCEQSRSTVVLMT